MLHDSEFINLFKDADCEENKILEHLIVSRMDINKVDAYGNTLLMAASYMGYSEIVKYLIGEQVKLDDINRFHDTALHIACEAGHLAIVQLLVKNKADILVKNIIGDSAFQIAAGAGHLEIVKYLYAKPHFTGINTFNNSDFTPLTYAIKEGHKEITEFLVTHGADVNLKEEDGSTPLHTASRFNQITIARFLIVNGADIDHKNDDGDKAIDVAETNEMKKMLLNIANNHTVKTATNQEAQEETLENELYDQTLQSIQMLFYTKDSEVKITETDKIIDYY